MEKFNLAGKTALVTGGASGIGLATATMMAATMASSRGSMRYSVSARSTLPFGFSAHSHLTLRLTR